MQKIDTLTACPLDCYDACMINYSHTKLMGVKQGYTQGFLCPHLNHFDNFTRIKKPRYKNQEISIDEAINRLVAILRHSKNILHFRGHGNFALMQEVTDLFFSNFGATLTNGTLCDGAGEAGIITGRGHVDIMTPKQIKKAEVIIFWGRNPHTTSSHLLPYLKDKIIIVIDPIKTKIAKNADCHIQLKPHADLKFAMLLVRFLYIEDSFDKDFLEKYTDDYEEFYELTQTIRIKATLDEIDVTLDDISKVLKLIQNKTVAIICGVGVQKYIDGADVLRAIDAFAAFLGLFGKEGCGVSYLGSSKQNIPSPFTCKAQKISKVDTKFSHYDTIFIQGSNPLNQMPNTNRVECEIKQVKNLIYFGLYENQTSALADLIIPAKTFLEKNDIRTSYSTHVMLKMPKQRDSKVGISEYDLTKKLCQEFKFKIKQEQKYIEYFKSFAQKNLEDILEVKDRDEISYQNGFTTYNKKFIFLEEFDTDFDMDNNMFLITCKAPTSLNSQFRVDKYVYLHPDIGFNENQKVKISTDEGSLVLHVKLNNKLRKDCVLIYSGTNGVNRLTTSKRSHDGNSAIFEQNKVTLLKV